MFIVIWNHPLLNPVIERGMKLICRITRIHLHPHRPHQVNYSTLAKIWAQREQDIVRIDSSSDSATIDSGQIMQQAPFGNQLGFQARFFLSGDSHPRKLKLYVLCTHGIWQLTTQAERPDR
jgi:hypothetical protein